jgi:predicted nuclease of predicted toxin-antitoxin system
MRLLVDENLSVRIAARLGDDAGHDAVHVTTVGLGSTDDAVILEAAAESGQVALTADADFSTMLALQGRSQPSVLMLHSPDHLTPHKPANLILRTLEQVGNELEDGAIASVTPERIRIRTLPISQP